MKRVVIGGVEKEQFDFYDIIGARKYFVYRTKQGFPLSAARLVYTEDAPWNWTVDTIYQTIIDGLRPPVFLQVGDVIVLEHGERREHYRVDESANIVEFSAFEAEYVHFKSLSDETK